MRSLEAASDKKKTRVAAGVLSLPHSPRGSLCFTALFASLERLHAGYIAPVGKVLSKENLSILNY